MTETATRQRLTLFATARGATCTIAAEGNRLLVQWDAPDWQTWHEMFVDWKRMLGRHSDAVWREKTRCWSLPLSSRQKLQEWAETWRNAGMTITDTSLGPIDVPGQPGAHSGRDDELARLERRRARMVMDLRRLPDHGAIARCLKRSLSLLDEEIAVVIAGRGEDGV